MTSLNSRVFYWPVNLAVSLNEAVASKLLNKYFIIVNLLAPLASNIAICESLYSNLLAIMNYTLSSLKVNPVPVIK